MHFYLWDRETRDAYAAIRRYRKTADRFLKGNPTPDEALRLFDRARTGLEFQLRRPEIAQRLDRVIGSTSSSSDSSASGALDQLSLTLELQLASSMGLRAKAVRKALGDSPQAVHAADITVNSADALVAELNALHKKAVAEVTAARQEPNRIIKKKRKRDIKRGVLSAIFGTGCTIGNSYPIVGMPPMQFSYAVALALFHQAARDVIGDPPKD